MFTRLIMDFEKIVVIRVTEKQFLYAKNNIFDADRSVVSLKGKFCSIWLWAYKTQVDIYTGSTAAQIRFSDVSQRPFLLYCLFDVKLTLTETIKTKIYHLSAQEYLWGFHCHINIENNASFLMRISSSLPISFPQLA